MCVLCVRACVRACVCTCVPTNYRIVQKFDKKNYNESMVGYVW